MASLTRSSAVPYRPSVITGLNRLFGVCLGAGKVLNNDGAVEGALYENALVLKLAAIELVGLLDVLHLRTSSGLLIAIFTR